MREGIWIRMNCLCADLQLTNTRILPGERKRGSSYGFAAFSVLILLLSVCALPTDVQYFRANNNYTFFRITATAILIFMDLKVSYRQVFSQDSTKY